MTRLALAVPLAIALGCAEPEAPRPASEEDTAARPAAAGFTVTGRAPRASGGFPSVLLFEPVDGEPFPLPEPETRPLMDQYGIEFHPSILLARAGQTLEFRNSEDELHNVRVVHTGVGKTLFNVATPVVGSYSHEFDEPGVYDVSCDTHPAMAAFIIVSETPYVVIANKSGPFTIEGLPEGTYHVRVWNVSRKRRTETTLHVDRDHAELDLSAGKPVDTEGARLEDVRVR